MKFEEKKHVKPKCDCKRKKNKNLGIIEIENQEKQKTLFSPIIKKIMIL